MAPFLADRRGLLRLRQPSHVKPTKANRYRGAAFDLKVGVDPTGKKTDVGH
jgi:hypothetical protein